jgi:hypothetical protein
MWAALAGGPPEYTLANWDPKSEQLVTALFEILASGSSVFLKPAGSGQSMSIAVWEPDERHPGTWFAEVDELDAWAARVIEMAATRNGKGREPTGA